MSKTLLHFLISTLAYFIAGKLGLLLAIPPGFASAVWPASGVALACLLFGQRVPVLLGIAAGSFSINILITSNNFSFITPQAIMIAGFLASGAMTQAWVGHILFVRIVGNNHLLDSPKEIFNFIVFIVLCTSCIAASIGVTTLYLNSLVSLENYFFSWATWWIGDAIGVLLFTPGLITIFSSNFQVSVSRKLQTILPTVTVFVGILVLFSLSKQNQDQQIKEDINNNAQRFFYLFERNILEGMNTLAAYAGLFSASKDLNWENFEDFSDAIKQQGQVFDGIGWTQIISHQSRQEFIETIRQGKLKQFEIKEKDSQGNWIVAPIREEYYPVIYIYPLQENASAIGFNLGSNPSRLQTLLSVKANAKPQATPPIQLVQEKSSGLSSIIYYPVYSENQFSEKVFHGYISGVLRLNRLFEDLLSDQQFKRFNITLTDIDSNIEIVETAQAHTKFDSITKDFDFAGRTYRLNFFLNPQYLTQAKDWTSFTILTIGLVFAALLQAFILLLTGNNERIKKEVETKTRDLQNAKQTAELASKAKSEFTANISHELRTPLNAVIGLLNQCLKTPLDTQQKNYLNKARLAGETLTSIINSTLDFSKIEAGQFVIENQSFNLLHLLRKIQAIFEQTANERNLKFTLTIPEEIPELIEGDPLRLEQVMLNLLSNAFKFTKSGEISVGVIAEEKTSTSINITFIIKDSGIGIPSDKIATIFESFQQVNNSVTRQYGGTGLGLTISRKFVQLMGGDIQCNSIENEGSTFTFTLRFNILHNVAQAVSDSETDIKFTNYDHLINTQVSGKNVLIVEDVEINRLIVTELLQEHGIKVTQAENGIEALNILQQSDSFDFILMDIQMPLMDGHETTKTIRQNPQWINIPIIAMTANAMKEDIEDCLKSGMNAHIAKPIDEKNLLETIIKQLSK